MAYRSVFEIIGPVMIGPSSSHTAGAVRLGQLARRIFGMQPEEIRVQFYGSFAQTYRGHATDVAVVAGLLDLDTDDPRIPDALSLAAQQGMEVAFSPEQAVPTHPNTVGMVLTAEDTSFQVVGVSLGGGLVQITEVDGFSLRLSGESPALLIFHRDAYGAVASVTQLLAGQRVNINHMEVSRSDRGKLALMVIETDERVEPDLLRLIGRQQHITKVVTLNT